MTLIYVNGGSPTYPGWTFLTGTALLNKIRDELVNAGWTVLTDTIPTLLLMRGVAPDAAPNNHNCWFRFSIPTAGTLRVVGDRTGDGSSLSPNFDHPYTDAVNNSLWLTADSDAFCLAIKSAANAWQNMHAGFVKRIEASDRWAWMIGRLDHLYSSAFWAQNFSAANNWSNAAWNFRGRLTNATAAALFTTAGLCGGGNGNDDRG
jgi:hypothetical protein